MIPAPLVALLRVLVAVCALGASAAWAQGTGSVTGRVFDAESGEPVAGATVVLQGAAPADGSAAFQQVATSGADGAFRFGSVPEGSYTLSFTKSGYRASRLGDLTVQAGQPTTADFPLPRGAAGTAEQILELDAFAVEASTVEEGADLLELRLDADQFLNTLSAEEFAKFAASDVAEALRRVAGVNVADGRFAIIRGLEDRYNSTLYNGAPIPSPDPDKQSVQLDLFPSEIVSNLVVSKTFVPELPSNTSGGAVDILTGEYPEDLELKVSGGLGGESNAWDRFLRLEPGSPVGSERSGSDVLESEFGGSFGGRKQLFGREIRFKGLLNREIDYRTAEGFQEGREPRSCLNQRQRACKPGEDLSRSGDLALGELFLSDGKFDLTQSERAQQDTGYLGLGLDLDEEADHRIDVSSFYSKNEEEVVQLKENGYIPNFDYGLLDLDTSESSIRRAFNGFATFGSWIARDVRDPDQQPDRGPLWFGSFFESRSFDIQRDLRVLQINGDHRFDAIDPLKGLRVTWAGNKARTTQDEDALGMRFFFEPDETPEEAPSRFPVTPGGLGPGQFVSNAGLFLSSNSIEENQDFGRVDVEYEKDVSGFLTLRMNGGVWYEKADREVESVFLEGINLDGSSQFAIFGQTPEALGEKVFEEINAFQRESSNESKREIRALQAGATATLWDRLDLLGGVRAETIFIESINDAFTGDIRFGAPATFPEVYLLFDRLDNPDRGEVVRAPDPDTVFNDQILGIDVSPDPETGFVDLLDRAAIQAAINGEIDETKILPSLGFAYRPLQGLSLRGAYSQTVARPSFREIGFYVSVEPGSDDLVVGNPRLQLSEVESYDLRAEYTWGQYGDLVAVSGFYKEIDDPIESIVIRNPINFEQSSSALFRTFFNNPNQATLMGVELEGRKNLGFFGPDWLRYFSVGGNFTYIDAEVDRTEAELARSVPFFGTAEGDEARFEELSQSRRLFNQPEWIANADISYDNPDTGTKATLAFFAISDLLDAAGSATILPNGEPRDFTLDRYVDSLHQLDFNVRQRIPMPRDLGTWTLKLTVKNLTDSKRAIVYDPEQTRGRVEEREHQVGQDYSFSVTYEYRF
jgi:outer membrane receptor protein involved in Fe transport